MGGKSLEACRDVVVSSTQSRMAKIPGGEYETSEKTVARTDRLCGEKLMPTEREARAALDRVVNGYCSARPEIRDCKVEKKSMGPVDVHEVKPQVASKEPGAWQRFFSLFAKPVKPGMY